MKVKNTSVKILNVAGVSLMPDEEQHIDDSLINAPVRCIAKLGLISLTEEPKKVVKAAPKQEEVQEEVEEKPAPKKGGRPKKTE